MKYLHLSILVVFFIIFAGCNQKEIQLPQKIQKRVYTVSSVRYMSKYESDNAARECEAKCIYKANPESIDNYLSQNWRVISSSPKDFFVDSYCTCVGTEYVIEK